MNGLMGANQMSNWSHVSGWIQRKNSTCTKALAQSEMHKMTIVCTESNLLYYLLHFLLCEMLCNQFLGTVIHRKESTRCCTRPHASRMASNSFMLLLAYCHCLLLWQARCPWKAHKQDMMEPIITCCISLAIRSPWTQNFPFFLLVDLSSLFSTTI